MALRFATKTGGALRGRKANLSRKQIVAAKKDHLESKLQKKDARQAAKDTATAMRGGSAAVPLRTVSGKQGLKRRKLGGASTVLSRAGARIAAAAERVAAEMQVSKKRRADINKNKNRDGQHVRGFDHDELHQVSEGLEEVIKGMGETPTPLTMFACAMTTLSSATVPPRRIPYLLVVMGACCPKLSQNVLKSRLGPLFRLIEQLIAEHSSDELVTNKAIKAAESALSCVRDPEGCAVLEHLKRLEPQKHSASMMSNFLQLTRKYILHCFLSGLHNFYYKALAYFSSVCSSCMTDAGMATAAVARREFIVLLEKTLSPTVIECSEGYTTLNHIIKEDLTVLFRPHARRSWAHAANMTEALFIKLAYLKRSTRHPDVFTTWFPDAAFLLRVLDKIRQIDDQALNSHMEKAIVSIGNCIPCSLLVDTLPFDPRMNKQFRLHGNANLAQPSSSIAYVMDSDDPVWKRSYMVQVLRRACSHDSLPFFVESILPLMKFCETASKTAENIYAPHWAAMHMQYWRVLTSFCQYPLTVTEPSLRVIAQTITMQLSRDCVDAAATSLHILCSTIYGLSVATTNPFGLDDEPKEDDFAADDMGLSNHHHHHTAGDSLDDAMQRLSIEEDLQYLAYNDAEWDPHTFHGMSAVRAKEICMMLSAFSKNIMPRLCNTFETHDSTAVLDAITSFSLVCAPDVMETILNGILAVSDNIAADKTFTAKRRVILDITCALVKQLPAENLMVVLNRIVEPVLSDTSIEQRLLQKKAYKLLYSIFEHRLKDVLPELPRIISLLSAGQQHVTVSSLKMRVRCLSWAIDAYKMYNPDGMLDCIREALGEVILYSKEQSKGARELAMEVLEKMQRHCEASGAGPGWLLHQCVGGLSGRTGMLMAGSVVAMAKVMSSALEKLPQSDVTGAVNVVSRLVDHSIVEVRNSAVLFLRMVFKLAKKNTLAKNALVGVLSRICDAVAIVTSQPQCPSTTRNTMRILLEKCITHFGYDEVDAVFPVGSKRFLIYAHKMLKKTHRKEEKHILEKNSFQELFMREGVAMGANADFDEDELDEEEKFAEMRRKQRVRAMTQDGEGSDEGSDEDAYEQPAPRGRNPRRGADDDEDEDARNDLLRDGALSSFVGRQSRNGGGGMGGLFSGDDDGGDDSRDRDTMVMVPDPKTGKLRIITKVERDREVDQQRREAMAERLLKKGANLTPGSLNESASGAVDIGVKRGRGRDGEVQDYENQELILRYGKGSDDKRVAAHMRAGGAGAGTNAAALAAAQAATAAAKGDNRGSALAYAKAQFLAKQMEKREAKRARFEQDIKKGEEYQGKNNTGLGDVKSGGIDPYAYVPLDRRFMNKRHRVHGVRRFESVAHKGNLKGGKAGPPAK